jgi:hypothetical protein
MIKVYFDILDTEEAQKRIEYARSVYKQLQLEKEKIEVKETLKTVYEI